MFFKPNIERLKQKKDIKGLVKALGDTRKLRKGYAASIGDKASSALIEIGDRSIVPELINIVEHASTELDMTYLLTNKKRPEGEFSEEAVLNAVSVLSELGDSAAIPALEKALSNDKLAIYGGFHNGDKQPVVDALKRIRNANQKISD